MIFDGQNAQAPFDVSTELLDLLPAAVCISDARGVIRYYNHRAAELWGGESGIRPGGDRSRALYRFSTADGGPLAGAMTPISEVLRAGQPRQKVEANVECPDGSRFAAIVDIEPIRHESGELVATICVFHELAKPSEDRFRSLIAALPAAVYVTDPEGHIQLFNDAAAELWGRCPDLGKEMWCGSFRIFRPDGSPMPLDQCPMAVAVKENRSVTGAEIVVERPDGARRYVMPHPEPLHNPAGEMVGAVNMLIDVTDRKHIERQVHDSQARFRAIVEATPECVQLISREGTLLEINPAGLAMVDAARAEEIVGRSVYDLIAPRDRQAAREFNERVCQGEGGCLEFEMIGLRGTRRQMESHAVPLLDSAGHSVQLAVTRDVTEARRADVERNLLAAIVASSDDAIVSKNLDGIITSWNQGAQRIFGYSAAEAVGKHISLIIPPDQADDVSHVLDRIRRGERIDHYQTKRRTKDGDILDISLTVSPVRDTGGNIVGASKVARNITREKRTAEALKRSEDQLRDANRRKDEFLAMLAHELRNPLAAIQNAVKLARKSEPIEQLEWSTEVIERQVKQLARLTDDLLDVSRISQGKIHLRKEVVDIGPVLYGAVDTVRPLIEDRKHELNVSFGPGVLRVKADPVRLEQVVVNLLTNAAKYTESGGRISLIAEQDASYVVISVCDTGIGIPPEKLPEMFDLFVQGDCSLAHSEGGLGIGLTLVKNLVEMHDGAVTASSAGVGKGSEFKVRIPASASPPTECVKVPSATGKGQHASRVLVVDDNVDSANGLARLLKLLGHEVRTAHDGKAAIALAETYQPSLVLLDIGLPGMDGYEVAAQLRESGTCKDTVIVAVSGYGQEEDRRRGREAGFNFHLVKPIDHDALITLLSATRMAAV